MEVTTELILPFNYYIFIEKAVINCCDCCDYFTMIHVTVNNLCYLIGLSQNIEKIPQNFTLNRYLRFAPSHKLY